MIKQIIWRLCVGQVPYKVHKQGTPEYCAYREKWYARVNFFSRFFSEVP